MRIESFLTNPKIRGNPLHFPHEVSTKVLDILQIILHGEGEVHKIIEVYGVIFSTLEFQIKSLGFALRDKRSFLLALKYTHIFVLVCTIDSLKHQHYIPSWIFTRSEGQGEFLWLDLSDLFRLHLLGPVFLAVGYILVLIDLDCAARILNTVQRTVSFLQGCKIIAASRLGLTFTEECLEEGTN